MSMADFDIAARKKGEIADMAMPVITHLYRTHCELSDRRHIITISTSVI
jgi:hypothetical protein